LPQPIEQALELAERFAHDPQRFSDADLVARAVPPWVRDEMDATGAWARAIQAEPFLWLRAPVGRGPMVARKLGDCRPFGDGQLADTLQYLGKEDLFRLPEFHHGEFEVQDLGSQAVGFICAPQPGETWWDACAGEGGKTLHLSNLMGNKGLIWASDKADWRLQVLKRRAGRAGVFNYRLALWNGGATPPTKTRFDGVLVDAPCSGFGTWQRNPHARWTVTSADVKELSELQQQILAHAAPSVKPGGRLVYAVCTLTRAETETVARVFDQQFPGFKREMIRNPLKPESPAQESLYLWPQDSGGNGMFVAAWKRVKITA
jgi:16S rRNA (cytosine967-C5)-methyltransferase